MTAAQRFTGKNLVVQFIDAAGTATLSGDQTALSVDMGVDTVDMSAGADAARYSKGTLKTLSATLEAFHIGTAGTAVRARVEPNDEGTLIWAPLGTAAGMPKWGSPVLVTSVNESFPFDDAVKTTVEFEQQGDLAFNGNTATF